MAADLMQALSMRGRNGDDRMAHMGPGETVIPPRVMIENPALINAIAKAMGRSGLDWRQYMSGSPMGSFNPTTGAQEFYDFGFEAAEANAGMSEGGATTEMGAGDVNAGDVIEGGDGQDQIGEGAGDTDVIEGGGVNTGDPNDPNNPYGVGGPVPIGGKTFSVTSGDVGSFLGGALGSLFGGPLGGTAGAAAGRSLGGDSELASFSIGSTLGYQGSPFDPFGGFTLGNPDMEFDLPGGVDRGTEYMAFPVSTAPRPVPSAPPPAAVPPMLAFDPTMTDLQRRAMIATYGAEGTQSPYRDPSVTDYYKSLLRNALGGQGYDAVLPIEERYLRNTLGLNFQPNTASLLAAL